MSVYLYMKHKLPLEIIDHTLTCVVNYDMQLLPFDEENEVRTKNETKLSSFFEFDPCRHPILVLLLAH